MDWPLPMQRFRDPHSLDFMVRSSFKDLETSVEKRYHGSGHNKSRAEFNQEVSLNCKLERGMSLMECSGETEKAWILVNTGLPSLVPFASNALIYGSVGGWGWGT